MISAANCAMVNKSLDAIEALLCSEYRLLSLESMKGEDLSNKHSLETKPVI